MIFCSMLSLSTAGVGFFFYRKSDGILKYFVFLLVVSITANFTMLLKSLTVVHLKKIYLTNRVNKAWRNWALKCVFKVVADILEDLLHFRQNIKAPVRTVDSVGSGKSFALPNSSSLPSWNFSLLPRHVAAKQK